MLVGFSNFSVQKLKSDDASIGFCPCCKTTLEDRDHVLRCPAQKHTRYLALKNIRGTIAETRPPAGPILWHGLKHWLSNTSEPLSIDTSRYSGRIQLLVQQALAEHKRICYNKTPQPNAWVISTLANLGTFSKAMWTDYNQKLHDTTNSSSPTSDLDADIATYYAIPQDLLAANRQILHRPISKVLRSRRSTKTKWIRSIRRAHRRFLADRTNRQHTSSTDQFLLPVSVLPTFVHHRCTPKSHVGPATCQNGSGPGRANSHISNEVWRSI
jgi:hypothetical protein